MNKLELIGALKNQTDLSKAEAAGVIELVFDMMTDALFYGYSKKKHRQTLNRHVEKTRKQFDDLASKLGT